MCGKHILVHHKQWDFLERWKRSGANRKKGYALPFQFVIQKVAFSSLNNFILDSYKGSKIGRGKTCEFHLTNIQNSIGVR